MNIKKYIKFYNCYYKIAIKLMIQFVSKIKPEFVYVAMVTVIPNATISNIDYMIQLIMTMIK